MRIADRLRRGGRAAAAQARLLGAIYLVQLGLAFVCFFAVATTVAARLGTRPILAQAAGGDDAALLSLLTSETSTVTALSASAVGLLVVYALVSLFLSAGLLGAMAGKGFVATARARFGVFVRLWLWALVPYLVAGITVAAGLWRYGPVEDDLVDQTRVLLRTLAGAGPGLLLVVVTMCAVDHARAELVVTGDRRAISALVRAFSRVVTRPTPLVCYALYLAFWVAITALYVTGTAGRPFAGFGGALLLLAIRQIVAAARFAARAWLTGAQLSSQADVVEARQL